MTKLSVPSVARARRIVEERLIRMKQQIRAAGEQCREGDRHGLLRAQKTAQFRALRLSGIAAGQVPCRAHCWCFDRSPPFYDRDHH